MADDVPTAGRARVTAANDRRLTEYPAPPSPFRERTTAVNGVVFGPSPNYLLDQTGQKNRGACCFPVRRYFVEHRAFFFLLLLFFFA